MNRELGLSCLLGVGLLCALAGAARGDRAYTNQADWLAAVSALGDVRALSLTPVEKVSDTGAVYADDEGTLSFPDNHGGLRVFSDGWFGDVHSGGSENAYDHEPHENRFTFARPIVAFAATIKIGADWSPEVDSLLLSFNENPAHRLMIGDYSPGFFGWVGTVHSAELLIESGGINHFYGMTDVRYVLSPAMSGESGAVPVPAPSSAVGGLALLGMLMVSRARRAARRHRVA